MLHFTAICKNSTKRMNQNYLKTRYKDKIRYLTNRVKINNNNNITI